MDWVQTELAKKFVAEFRETVTTSARQMRDMGISLDETQTVMSEMLRESAASGDPVFLLLIKLWIYRVFREEA